MIAILTSWLQFSKKYVCPHLLMGVVAACCGMPVYQSQFLALSEKQQLTDWHLLGKDDHLHKVMSQQRAMANQVTFLPDYWQRYAIKLAIRHLMSELPRIESSPRRALAQLTLRQLAECHAQSCQSNALQILLYHSVLSVIDRTATRPHCFCEALWLAIQMGIRAGPISM